MSSANLVFLLSSQRAASFLCKGQRASLGFQGHRESLTPCSLPLIPRPPPPLPRLSLSPPIYNPLRMQKPFIVWGLDRNRPLAGLADRRLQFASPGHPSKAILTILFLQLWSLSGSSIWSLHFIVQMKANLLLQSKSDQGRNPAIGNFQKAHGKKDTSLDPFSACLGVSESL